MSEHNHYVPILKGRQGEYTALGALRDHVRAQITPLVEVAPVPWDFESDTAAKSVDAHLEPVAAALAQCWGTGRPVFVDLTWIAEDSTEAGLHPVESVLNEARQLDLKAIPVAGVARSDPYLAAVATALARDDRGVCLRLERDDLRNLNRLGRTLNTTCAALGADREQVDLILDFKDYDGGQAPAIEMAASVALTSLPNPDDWRSLALAGGGFPLNLTGIGAETRIARADWDVWRTLTVDRADEMPRRPAFADYAVQHPEPQEIDPRLMRMSASLRYATPTEWLILKGRNVRDYGFEQFHDLCADLVPRPEFRGPDFSEGDRLIASSANRNGGPGNATTWRKIATNHHLETVADQIANLP